MKKFVFFLNLTAIAMIFVLFFSMGTYAGCTKDIDCKGDRVCENGICVDPGQTKPNKEQESLQNLAGIWRNNTNQYNVTIDGHTIEITFYAWWNWKQNRWELMGGRTVFWRGTITGKAIKGKWIADFIHPAEFKGERDMKGTISENGDRIHLDYKSVTLAGFPAVWVDQNWQTLDIERDK